MRGAARNCRRSFRKHYNFYSRASCEARLCVIVNVTVASTFLLTRLMRGAASSVSVDTYSFTYFYSRASCEARPASSSTHLSFFSFLLTRLMRGAALEYGQLTYSMMISTHAPHARRGAGVNTSSCGYINFYSRASCEARPQNLV